MRQSEDKQIIWTTFQELNDVIDSINEEESYDPGNYDEREVRNASEIGDDVIYTNGPTYVVEDMGITVVEGTYCNYNEETGEYEPDWSLTLIYNTTDAENLDYNDFTYFEQDPPAVSIHNYRHMLDSVFEPEQDDTDER